MKKNIIKRYFEKRAQKKADIKDGLIALEEKRLRELLRKKIKPSDTLYNGAPQYQFHKSDLDFYISNSSAALGNNIKLGISSSPG